METFEQLVARVNANAWIPVNPEEVLMAKQVKLPKGVSAFKFEKSTGGGEAKYQWADWLNGDLLMIEQSEGKKDEKGTVVEVTVKKDYEAPTNHMTSKLRVAARKRYKIVQISRKGYDGKKLGDALIIQARDMTPDEKVAEDLLRAEEKAAKEKKAAEEKAAANGTDTSAAPADTSATPAA